MSDAGQRVLVVDDENAIRRYLRTALTAQGFSVYEASNGQETLNAVVENRPDVIILDLGLPDFDGVEVTRRLREWSQTPIIILSVREAENDKIAALDAGADDYLTKPFAFSELLARVQALMRRSSSVSEPTQLNVAGLSVNLLTREVIRDGQRIELQPLEFSLLEYLMRNHGRVVSKTMIMEHVWDYNFDPQTNVVEARISRLRDKIDRLFSRKLIHTIRGAGYVLRETP